MAALVFAALAAQGTAVGALTANSAKLNGATSVSTPPGGVMSANLNVSVTGSSDWKGTQYGFNAPNPTTCVDTNDRGSSGSNTFNVTAPAAPGDYAAQFRARGKGDCTGDSSNVLTLPAAVKVTTPAPNPDLPPRCGINVMLILDESGSIGPPARPRTCGTRPRRSSGRSRGTGSKVSIIEFSSSANRPVGYTTVTPETHRQHLQPLHRQPVQPERLHELGGRLPAHKAGQ